MAEWAIGKVSADQWDRGKKHEHVETVENRATYRETVGLLRMYASVKIVEKETTQRNSVGVGKTETAEEQMV